ncbi:MULTISPECIES: DsbA family protein [unclassified Crossiella]|uniref:DsbA family protein n=1 Tax=unclassified Crossiella TaxID=2620835 RepID=UPI0020002AA9|nr:MULTISPECIES: DsbA family protein [unclassified Crossiella]MCK2243053.1 DsbA family protein [Crossiella sp. S99.2]MCK2256930.1 DsbA family protein [Crossiella sp. S99.1]
MTVRLVYVLDAYCGWCYGFSRTMAELTAAHPGLPVEVVSGGLFTGDRRRPIGQYEFIRDANERITDLTGVSFGAGFERLLDEGSFVMDSEAAARGVAALRALAPDRAVELVGALQDAYYQDGQSLSDPATYRALAERTGLEPDLLVAAFESPNAVAEAAADFRFAGELGVQGFPTLLVVDEERVATLAVGHASTEEVTRRLAALR